MFLLISLEMEIFQRLFLPMKEKLSPISFRWEVVVLKGNKFLLNRSSDLNLSSYVGVTVQMQKESRQRLATLENYRDLYTETRRCRLHSLELHSSQMEISMGKGIAIHQQGGIVIVKK